MSSTILIIEDDQDIAFLVQSQLKTAGYHITLCHHGDQALQLIDSATHIFDLYIVDRLLPGVHGLELCRHIRRSPVLREQPILLLTALDQSEDIILGLDAGADDYITKPFEMSVLLARVRALLRRKTNELDSIRYHNLEIQPKKFELKIHQEKVHLTATEWQILITLLEKRGHVFTREEMIKKIQGPNVHITERTIDTHIAGLRKKLAHHSEIIETIRGVGYRFKEPG
jgi:DNA-binding response OmpR family regulator